MPFIISDIKNIIQKINSKLKAKKKFYIFFFVYFLFAISITGISNLFNEAIPSAWDNRAHIVREFLIYENIKNFHYTNWNEYWYCGLPLLTNYGIVFYFVVAITTFLTNSVVISHKIWTALTLVLNGLALFYYTRKVHKISLNYSFLSGILFLSSSSLLGIIFNDNYGAIPFSFSWAIMIFAFTYYYSIAENFKNCSFKNYVIFSSLSSLVLLSHIFAFLFLVIAIILHIIIFIFLDKEGRKKLKSAIKFFLISFLIMLGLSSFWLIPFVVNVKYLSSLYMSLNYSYSFAHIFNMFSLLFITFSLLYLHNIKKISKVFIFSSLLAIISLVLGFNIFEKLELPFGESILGWRYYVLGVPFFTLSVIISVFETTNKKIINIKNIIFIVLLSIVFIFILFLFYNLNNILKLSLDEEYSILFAFSIISFICFIFYIFYKYLQKIREFCEISVLFSFFVIATIILPFTIGITIINNFNFNEKTEENYYLKDYSGYQNGYLKGSYSEILYLLKDTEYRVIVQGKILLVCESPVTILPIKYKVETTTGPFNQGDPKFFKYTDQIEWVSKWRFNNITRTNLMMESNSKYLICDTTGVFGDIKLIKEGNGVYLYELENYVPSLAVKVKPILLDVEEEGYFTDYLNILMPEGYKFPLISVKENNAENFDTVITDCISKKEKYQDKKVIVLTEGNKTSILLENESYYVIETQLLKTSKRLFVQEEGEVERYGESDRNLPTNDEISNAKNLSMILDKIINPEYENLQYKKEDGKISVIVENSSWILIKETWYPSWEFSDGNGNIYKTTQGWILINTNQSITIVFNEFTLDIKIGIFTSFFTLIIIGAIFVVLHRNKRRDKH